MNLLRFAMVMARRGTVPVVLSVLLILAWWVCVLCAAVFTLFTGSVEQSMATLLMGLFATFVVVLYIALFLLIPGSLYIWAVRRAGKALNDDQWNKALAPNARYALTILCVIVLAASYVLFGHLFEVGDHASYTSFFSMPIQTFYDIRATFPFFGAMLIAIPFWVFLYKMAKRRNHADKPAS